MKLEMIKPNRANDHVVIVTALGDGFGKDHTPTFAGRGDNALIARSREAPLKENVKEIR
jgi:NAD(P)-dependent dehydrogenase (short-subunit alcohol dehydrogenase family)